VPTHVPIYSSWHHDSGVGAAQGIRWTTVYALCIVGTAVPTLMGYVVGHRLHEERPGQRGRRQYGSIEPAAPPDLPHRLGHGDKEGKMGRMDGAARINIKPGLRVSIVLKPDQRSGKLTEGVVKDILTHASTHPHGITVRLATGHVGRVKHILL